MEEKFCATCEQAVKDGKTREVCPDCTKKIKGGPQQLPFPAVVRLTDQQAMMIGVFQGLVNAATNLLFNQVLGGDKTLVAPPAAEPGFCPVCRRRGVRVGAVVGAKPNERCCMECFLGRYKQKKR